MPSSEFVQWMAFYLVEYEINSDTSPPLEYDDPEEHAKAIDRLF